MQKMLQSGVLIALVSQILFSALYLFGHFMSPLTGTDTFALRMPTMLIGLLVILLLSTGIGSIQSMIRTRLGKDLKKWVIFLLGSFNAGSQFWLFMWAPVNNEGVNVAMGYFLFPLCMAVCGFLFFKAPLSRLQWIALGLAGIGVAHELWLKQSFSWSSLWVCMGYPFYYLSRRAMNVPALQGLTIDIGIMTVLCGVYLFFRSDVFSTIFSMPKYLYLLPMLGAFSAIAMFLNLKASAVLPVGLFSMLSYLEPALLFVLAITVLNAEIDPSAYWTYLPIWMGLLLLGVNGLQNSRKQKTAYS